jgi:hypothetical protein
VHDTKILSNFGLVTRLVNEIATDNDEGRPQAIGGGNRKFKIRRLLCEIPVIRVHPELRVRHLNEVKSRRLRKTELEQQCRENERGPEYGDGPFALEHVWIPQSF